ncbi:MAG TPA: hypothetical protein DET40_23455 [Lentisphaeria bacterium]|nr:hypothetical protein [Lentisphaeria bacterium]
MKLFRNVIIGLLLIVLFIIIAPFIKKSFFGGVDHIDKKYLSIDGNWTNWLNTDENKINTIVFKPYLEPQKSVLTIGESITFNEKMKISKLVQEMKKGISLDEWLHKGPHWSISKVLLVDFITDDNKKFSFRFEIIDSQKAVGYAFDDVKPVSYVDDNIYPILSDVFQSDKFIWVDSASKPTVKPVSPAPLPAPDDKAK